MTATEQQLADGVRITGLARDVQRCRVVAIIKARAAAHRAKKNNIIASLIADDLDELVNEINATAK